MIRKLTAMGGLTVFILLGIWLFIHFHKVDTEWLVRELEKRGYTVTDISPTINRYLAEGEKVYLVNKEQVEVFPAGNEEANERLAQFMEGAQNPLIDWMAVPHVYRQNTLAVIYIGNDQKLTHTLEQLMGKSLLAP